MIVSCLYVFISVMFVYHALSMHWLKEIYMYWVLFECEIYVMNHERLFQLISYCGYITLRCVIRPLIKISVLKINRLSSTVGSTENSSIAPMNFHWKGEVHWLQKQENFLSVHSALPMRRDGWGGVHWSGAAMKTAGTVTDRKTMAIICTVYLLRDKL